MCIFFSDWKIHLKSSVGARTFKISGFYQGIRSSRVFKSATTHRQFACPSAGADALELGVGRSPEGDLNHFSPIDHARQQIGYPWERSIQENSSVVFGEIFQNILEGTKGLRGISPLPLPEDFSYRLGGAGFLRGNQDPSVRMGTILFESDIFRRIRLTYYDGGPIQVVNSLWYPRSQYDIPLLGINVISFGETARQLCVIDFQPLTEGQREMGSTLEGIKKEIPTLSGNISGKFYDDRFFSPNILIGKFEDISNLNQATAPAVMKALEGYLSLTEGLEAEEIGAHHRDRMKEEYNRYNGEKDPSLGIYEAQFGSEWAREYVDRVKFA